MRPIAMSILCRDTLELKADGFALLAFALPACGDTP